MKIYSVELEVHYEGTMSEWIFLSQEQALDKFWELVGEQDSSTSVYMRVCEDGDDVRSGSVLRHSYWEYGKKSPKMTRS